MAHMGDGPEDVPQRKLTTEKEDATAVQAAAAAADEDSDEERLELECDFPDKCSGCSIKGARGSGEKTAEELAFERMHLANKLHLSARQNDVEKLVTVLAAGAEVNYPDGDNCTALWLATLRNHTTCVEALINHDGVDVDIPDTFGSSPLFIAARENFTDALRMLVQARADIDARDKRERQSPAYIAAQQNNADVLRILIAAGADINSTDKRKRTPVFAAAGANSTAALKVLIAEGEDCRACYAGVCRVIDRTVKCDLCSMGVRSPALMNLSNENNETPVFVAAKNNSSDALRTLIKAGADIDAADLDLKSPLFAAAEEGSVNALNDLIEAGA